MKNRIKLLSSLLIIVFFLTACGAGGNVAKPNGGDGGGDFELGDGSVNFGVGGEDVEQDLDSAVQPNSEVGNGLVAPESADADADQDLGNEGSNEVSSDVVEGAGSDGLEVLAEAEEIFGFAMPTENLIYARFEGETLNFQTNSDFPTMLDFTINSTLADGLTEHESYTAIVEGMASSMVFDGHESGKGIVIQITEIGDGVVNINVRFSGKWDLHDD